MSEFDEISENSEITQISQIDAPERLSGAKKNFFRTDGFVMLVIYFVTLIIHILLSLNSTLFNLTPDEYSVTAVAAYFNGYDWRSTVSTGGYYGYFQSLFYIPTFWLTDDPYIRYRMMLIINGILMSFAPVIAYWLLRKKFDVSKPASILFSGICGLYPCYVLLTKYTWNETMCNLIPWVFMLFLFKAADCESKVKKQIFSIAGGLTLAAAYATHGRMLSLLAAGAVLVLIVFFTMKKKRVFCLTGFYGALVAGFVADKFMKKYIQGVLWRVNEGKTPTNTIERMITRLFSTGGESGVLSDNVSIEKFFDTLVGHFFYFITSTWGFGAICIVAIISCIIFYYKRRNKPLEYDENGEVKKNSGSYCDDNTVVLCWFIFLAMGAIFAVSVAFKATSSLLGERMDTVLYGRYTEVFYPLAIFAALILIYKGRFSLMQSFSALLTGAGINLLTQIFVVPGALECDRFVSAMIMGLAPLRYNESMKDLFTQESFLKFYITTMTMLFVWVLVKVLRKLDKHDYGFFAVPLAALLLYSDVYGYVNYTVPQTKNSGAGAGYVETAMSLLDGEYDSITTVNLARERYTKAQFLYPSLDIEVVSSINKFRQIEEKSDICLAAREDYLSLWDEGVYLIGSPNNNVCVFAATEQAVQWARDKGLRVSESGSVTYTAAELPSTTHVVKEGHNADADMNCENEESAVTAKLPSGSSVYTNYFTIHRAGIYYVTVKGSGVNTGKISLTADKGETTLTFMSEKSDSDEICVRFTVKDKTENVRFKLTNSSGEQISVSSLTISNSAINAEE